LTKVNLKSKIGEKEFPMMRPPTSYPGWLTRLYSVNTPEEIVDAAHKMKQLMPDKKRLRADVTVAIAKKYRADKVRADDNLILKNAIKRKYETLTKSLLGGTITQMLAFADSVEQQ
jgi:hypothetical protein